MTWINALYETYQKISPIAGLPDTKGCILFPVGHITVKAQIEVTIDAQGNFVKADRIDKDDALTLIPVTEDSATRSNGVVPHPLNDKLCYLAGDYDDFFRPKKSKIKHHMEYIAQLATWANSDQNDEKVLAIYQYLTKGQLIPNLIQRGVLEKNEDGSMAKVKIAGVAQDDAFVRFVVWKAGADPKQYTAETWLDTGLQKKYITFYERQLVLQGLCYVTGRKCYLSTKHPNKIRDAGDKSKIISSNDDNTNKLTFRGRFKNSEESVAVSYDVSQKAHSTLRWLIERQGYHNYSECVVTWAIDDVGKKVPQPLMGTDALFEEAGVEKQTIDTAESFSVAFNKAIAGYHGELDTSRKIVIMAVDTADSQSQGRLAITYYQELTGSQYLENIKSWHIHGRWPLRLWDDEKEAYYNFVGVPSPREMALTAYGVEREVKNQRKMEMNDKLKKAVVQRILPCIAEGKKFPGDIMTAAVRNAGRPLTMSPGNWNRVLNNACSIICLYYYTQKGVKISMGLNENSTDRSYLFGRLLAVANYAEERTYDKDDKKRVSNARRYWNVFSNRPGRTWKIIYEKLLPYLDKLDLKTKRYIDKVFGEIDQNMSEEMMSDNHPLNQLYLLGYHHQTSILWLKKDQEKEGKKA